MYKSELSEPATIFRQSGGPVNIDDLADIRDVVIDPSLPKEEKLKSYLSQIKNPYLYRCGDTVIRASFADNGAPLADKLKQYFFSRRGLPL
jgi:hypothetical protein